jgi:hypothetical protein
MNCRDYLKLSTSNSNLTIIDRIETPKLILSIGANLFLTSQWNLTKPFLVKKGYVPLLRGFSNLNIMIRNKNDSKSPDYVYLYSKNNESVLFKISSLQFFYSNNTYNNILINFVFNNPNQTIFTSNYTLNYAHKLFGSFSVNVYTLFGGNLFTRPRRFINVQRIQSYPFKNIEMSQFSLNCSLNELNLDCILKVNLSNYANSFQQITIDYGDGSFDSMRINPYCKLFI